MKCVEFSPDLLSSLAKLVNTQLVTVPPGWTLTEAQVAQTIVLASDLWAVHYPEQASAFQLETLCVLDRGRLVAALEWGYPTQQSYPPSDSSCVLFWIVAESGNGEGIHLLLETLAEHAHAAKSLRITTSRFSFGVGWLGIPLPWSHIIKALQLAGFVVSGRWVILTSAAYIPDASKPKSLVSFDTSWQVDVNASEWELRLHTDDALVGECQAWGIPRHFSDCKGYADWITIEWLGVEPAYQRKGFGRWLIVEQSRKQAQRGVAHFIMWTETDNLPLLGLGESLGFQVGPECWEFEMVFKQ